VDGSFQSRGFSAEQKQPGESDFPELQNAEQHGKAIGDVVNLAQTVCIEAVKPLDGSGSTARIFHAIWLGP